MEEQSVRALYWNNTTVIDQMTELIFAVRQQNIPLANKQIPIIMKSLQKVLMTLPEHMELLMEAGVTWEESYLVSVLSQIEQAQIAGDYILMGDLYELQLMPALQDIQAVISNLDLSLVNAGWWDENMAVLEGKNPELCRSLRRFETGMLKGNADEYSVEPTTAGFFTLALEQDGRRWYLHSNRNPMEEARIWVRRNYRVEKENYTVLGWGMGYHIWQLSGICPDMDLTVIEPDIGTLFYSLHCNDWHDLLERITLIWDPEWKETTNLLSADREMLLYRPGIALVKNQGLCEMLNQLADRKDAIADSETVFYQNIRKNIQNCTRYIDELREQIKGRKVVIVAGGPSLDRNLEQLREKKEDTVVIAAGTVYKLLLQKGIPVDYVVISDTWVYHQVEGIEDPKAPVLLLATADRRISQYYQGNVYLVCQQGHRMAAEYAERRGYTCYSSGGSVVTLALDIAIRLGAGAIAFIGLDLAYYGNRMHASGTKRESFQGYVLQKEKAWDGSELNTSKAFLRFRSWMEERIQKADVTMTVVDATEGGIVKKGFIPMSLKEFLCDEN